MCRDDRILEDSVVPSRRLVAALRSAGRRLTGPTPEPEGKIKKELECESGGGLIGIALLAGVVLADTPDDGNYKVFDTQGNKIGNASVSDDGDDVGYVDNPNQNHPPNQDAVFHKDPETGNYGNDDPYWIVFDERAWGYVWRKYGLDENGDPQVVDSGTMVPTGPPTQPAP
jgi:hypothetical protein